MAKNKMRETRPEHFRGAIAVKVVCACGCGKKFAPKRSWHKFYSRACRKKAWQSTQITTAQIAQIESRLKRIEKHLRMKK